ncbi:hypothetical protein VTK73DRAFT_6795 [Phialemonium thermophilum]|uniref:RING-type E3 ubiquitin transferase n=1 Tax=Phialemonium thermophilum TaxID=223376 RepID=A0ABR3Y861_9PEZI
MDADLESEDIKTQVLRATLEEISTLRAEDTAECCVICLEEISEPSTAHPCGHANFDFLCLVSWTQRSPACPLCKATICEIRYGCSVTSDSGTIGSPKVYRVPGPQDRALDTASSSASQSSELLSGDLSHRLYGHYFFGRHRSDHHGRTPYRGVGFRRRRDSTTLGPTPTPDEAISRRRHVYRNQLYSMHVGSNRVSQYRDLTPELFASDHNLVSRARQWIRRELQVFEFLSSDNSPPTTHNDGARWSQFSRRETADERTRRRRANNAEFLLEYTIAILKTVDTQGSAGQAESMLADFLGRDCARLFLHELRSWLRSPFGSLEAWDRAVQYPEGRSGERGSAPRREKRSRQVATDDEESSSRGRCDSDLTQSLRYRGDCWRPRKRRTPEWPPRGVYGVPNRRLNLERDSRFGQALD